jgi:hypothetical protein
MSSQYYSLKYKYVYIDIYKRHQKTIYIYSNMIHSNAIDIQIGKIESLNPIVRKYCGICGLHFVKINTMSTGHF